MDLGQWWCLQNWRLDALEGSFALNLTMLAAATYYVKLSKGNQLAVGYISVIINIWNIYFNSQLPCLPATEAH